MDGSLPAVPSDFHSSPVIILFEVAYDVAKFWICSYLFHFWLCSIQLLKLNGHPAFVSLLHSFVCLCRDIQVMKQYFTKSKVATIFIKDVSRLFCKFMYSNIIFYHVSFFFFFRNKRIGFQCHVNIQLPLESVNLNHNWWHTNLQIQRLRTCENKIKMEILTSDYSYIYSHRYTVL